MRLPLVALLLVLAPLAVAAGPSPPAEAGAFNLEGRDVRVHFGPSPTDRNATVAADASETLWVAVPMERPDGNATAFAAYVNVSFFNATPQGASLVSGENATAPSAGSVLLRHVYATEPAEVGYHFAAFAFQTPQSGEFSYHLTVEAYTEAANGTTAFGTVVVDGGAPVVVAPGAPALPWTWIVVGAALLVGGGVAVGIRRRNERIRMNALDRRRSQALREEGLESQRAKKPAEVQRVQAEIRQAEQVREKRREVQILEAKRADALKTLELLQKRHESGAISKHQFDQMAAKKRADLARIDEEIAQFEAQDGGSAA